MFMESSSAFGRILRIYGIFIGLTNSINASALEKNSPRAVKLSPSRATRSSPRISAMARRHFFIFPPMRKVICSVSGSVNTICVVPGRMPWVNKAFERMTKSLLALLAETQVSVQPPGSEPWLWESSQFKAQRYTVFPEELVPMTVIL